VFLLVRAGGITFVVEDFRNVQASMWLPRDLFQEYDYRLGELIEFKVVLSALVECLNLFGPTDPNTMLEMVLPATREKLILT
jgi:Repair protein Rad1/Rec1/Rad17